MKKIFGIILIVISGIILLVDLFTLPNFMKSIFAIMTSANIDAIAYQLGSMTTTVILLVIGVLFLLLGLRLKKNTKLSRNRVKEN